MYILKKSTRSSKCTSLARGVGLALLVAVAAGPAQASVILLGSDYFQTTPGSFFYPPGGPDPIYVKGQPIGPGSTDTIMQRKQDCSLDLMLVGSNCSIPIELVALSLVRIDDPMFLVRESPTLASLGQMTIKSDGSGTGGKFDSFFDVFYEVSLDAGQNWIGDMSFVKKFSSNSNEWTTQPFGLLVPGLVGDQNANWHTNKGLGEEDFFVPKIVVHDAGDGRHIVRAAPVPATIPLLGVGLAALGYSRRKRKQQI